MILAIIGVIIGFVLLVKGADFFVEGSGSVAKKFNVPVFIIGMTIVAMGTSAPECAVSISASLHGSNGMAISNVIGSNIFNLLVVCGVCALFQPLEIKKETLKREFPFSVLVAVIIGIMGLIGMKVGHVEGIILVVLFAIFLYGMVRIARNTRKAGELVEEEEIKDLPLWKCLVFIGGGLVAIVIGGQVVVNCSETIARGFGLSETLIGLTICSIGTSLTGTCDICGCGKEKSGWNGTWKRYWFQYFQYFAGRWTCIRNQPDCNEHEQSDRYCDIGDCQCIYYGSCMEKTASDTGRWCEYACCLCSLYGLHLRQRSTVILDFTDHSLHSVKTIRRDLFF